MKGNFFTGELLCLGGGGGEVSQGRSRKGEVVSG